MNLQIKLLSPSASVPIYASEGAAAFDFFVPAGDHYVIAPGYTQKIGAGLAMAIPDGYVMLMFSRSGHGAKHGIRLANCVGVVDSDYRGEVIGAVYNDSSTNFTISSGERFMQGIIIARPTVTFTVLTDTEELPPTGRGAGGFGSTGAAQLVARGGNEGWGDESVATVPHPRPRPRSTHTLAGMTVTTDTYNEIANKLRAAGYTHAFMGDEQIDMSGIMISRN